MFANQDFLNSRNVVIILKFSYYYLIKNYKYYVYKLKFLNEEKFDQNYYFANMS